MRPAWGDSRLPISFEAWLGFGPRAGAGWLCTALGVFPRRWLAGNETVIEATGIRRGNAVTSGNNATYTQQPSRGQEAVFQPDCDGVAPRAGLEPATNRLTAERSTTELPGNGRKVGRRAILRNRALRCQGNLGKSSAYQRQALRRLTPTTMRSTRQVLVSRRRAASAGVMPWRATMVQTISAYSENGRCRSIRRAVALLIRIPFRRHSCRYCE